jgi:hypothetical protein
MSDYDSDIVLWSEEQAALLRRVAAGERLNEIAPDWPNIIEEIEGVGSERLHAVESLLLQSLVHMLKASSWPLARDAPSWEADAFLFRAQARRRFVPSMRQRIDLAGLYADALRAMPGRIDDQPPIPPPMVCPVTLDDLLAEDP